MLQGRGAEGYSPGAMGWEKVVGEDSVLWGLGSVPLLPHRTTSRKLKRRCPLNRPGKNMQVKGRGPSAKIYGDSCPIPVRIPHYVLPYQLLLAPLQDLYSRSFSICPAHLPGSSSLPPEHLWQIVSFSPQDSPPWILGCGILWSVL